MKGGIASVVADLYKSENLAPIITSITLFTLYSLAGLMEANMFMKDIGLGDASVSSAKLAYSIVATWFTWFLKVCLSLITIWALITVIRVSVSGIIEIFGKSMTSPGALKGVVQNGTESMTLWILGIFFLDNIMVFFGAMAPFSLLMLMIPYCIMVYSEKRMKRVEEEESSDRVKSVLNTMHHHVMMILSVIIMFIIINVTMNYIIQYDKINYS